MKSNMDDELSNEKIEDYNDNESSEKRNTVKLVVFGLILFAVIYGYFNSTSSSSSEGQTIKVEEKK